MSVGSTVRRVRRRRCAPTAAGVPHLVASGSPLAAARRGYRLLDVESSPGAAPRVRIVGVLVAAAALAREG